MEHKFIKSQFNIDKFLNDINPELKNKLHGFKSENGVVTVFTDIQIHDPEYLDLSSAISSHDSERSLTSQENHQKDKVRFLKRADKKNDIISTMAAGNLERVRNGVWTATDLISLTQDEELKKLLDDVNTLSFEIAYSKIDSLTNQLITSEIKATWKQLLLENFFL